ncbi:MAG: hypothetical protein WEA04_02395 [Candidatus Andersenbacteria bacterium]
MIIHCPLQHIQRTRAWLTVSDRKHFISVDNGGLDELLRRVHLELQGFADKAFRTAADHGLPLAQIAVRAPVLVDSTTWGGYAGDDEKIWHHVYNLIEFRQWFRKQIPSVNHCLRVVNARTPLGSFLMKFPAQRHSQCPAQLLTA